MKDHTTKDKPFVRKVSYMRYLTNEAHTIINLTLRSFPVDRIAILFSGGKDSCVLLNLIKNVCDAEDIPVPKLITIDTGYNFEEINDFIQSKATRFDVRRYSLSTDIYSNPSLEHNRNAAQSVTLKRAIKDLNLQAVFGGARRDEDSARAKERVFSHRDINGNWQPYNQRIEMYGLYPDLRLQEGEHFRVFPLSNWLERDVWEYIALNDVVLPDLYYAHNRPEYGDQARVRFRTVGDKLVTKPVFSEASTNLQIYQEICEATISERGATRLDDKNMSLEQRKIQGYF